MSFVPGPGSYTPKLEIGEKTMTSTYKQPNIRSFYHHDRFSGTTATVKCNIFIFLSHFFHNRTARPRSILIAF